MSASYEPDISADEIPHENKARMHISKLGCIASSAIPINQNILPIWMVNLLPNKSAITPLGISKNKFVSDQTLSRILTCSNEIEFASK
jgi:hypothetical protein